MPADPSDPYALDTSPTPGTKLLNATQWNEQEGEAEEKPPVLDEAISAEVDDLGELVRRIQYPSQWPKEFIGTLIPEFVAPGMLAGMEVSNQGSEPSVDDIWHVSLYLNQIAEEDAKEYAGQYVAFGYREVPPEEYADTETQNAAVVSALHVFTIPGMRVYLMEVPDQLRIDLYFMGRIVSAYEE
jgi:hypothetical protein